MLFIFGIRRIRIGRFIDTEYLCYPCRSYDHEVNVYRSYFHFCFIPVFPVGRTEGRFFILNVRLISNSGNAAPFAGFKIV